MSIEIDFDHFKRGLVPNEFDNFGALLFLMIAKADPENRAKLRLGFPEHVKMWEDWYNNPHP
jgi:hypothetical protein